MTPLRLLPWVLWLALAAFSVTTYELLPADIPQQLNAAGEITRTTERSPVAWGMLPAIALGMLLLSHGLSALLPARPELFNFPSKDKLLALPPAERAPVIAQMRTVMDLTSLLTMLIMLGVQWLLWESAQGRTTGVSSTVLVVVCFTLAPVLLLFVGRVNSATERAHAQWQVSRREAPPNAMTRGSGA
jgi:uncharacterized membrane protein